MKNCVTGGTDQNRRRLMIGGAFVLTGTLGACSKQDGASKSAAAASPPSRPGSPGDQPIVAEVWKTPTCGCCKAWIAHLESNGFSVKANDVANTTATRERLGIPAALGSCHTALIGGYVIEGHVPARDIKRLLAEKPDAVGLSVPGMPVGSPGMEQGTQRDKYDVLLVLKNEHPRVYQSYI